MRQEHGVQVIEFVGLLPFMLLATLIVVQIILFFYTFMVAANAASVGARAIAVGEKEAEVHELIRRSSAGLKWRFQDGNAPRCQQENNMVTVMLEVRVPFFLMPWMELEPLWTPGRAAAWCEPRP